MSKFLFPSKDLGLGLGLGLGLVKKTSFDHDSKSRVTILQPTGRYTTAKLAAMI